MFPIMDTSANDYNHEKQQASDAGKEQVIPVIQEQVTIEKKLVETGKIRVRKFVTEKDEIIDHTLFHEESEIQTIPINKYVDKLPPAVRQEGDTTIISILKEEVVVRVLLEKEIHITKKRIEHQESAKVTIRKEDVRIEKITPVDKQQS